MTWRKGGAVFSCAKFPCALPSLYINVHIPLTPRSVRLEMCWTEEFDLLQRNDFCLMIRVSSLEKLAVDNGLLGLMECKQVTTVTVTSSGLFSFLTHGSVLSGCFRKMGPARQT